jgi:hypothetical protein
MGSLVQEGLVKPVIPGMYIDEIPNFTEAFLYYVDSPEYPIARGTIDRGDTGTFRVHIEKLGNIGEELCRRRLAVMEEFPWYTIEAYTADQFMAYLAACLGRLPEIESAPVTDSVLNLDSFSPRFHRGGLLTVQLDQMRSVVLRDILPAPSAGTDPRELARFKRQNERQLRRFRNRVERSLIDAAAIEDPELRQESLDRFTAETRDDIEEISELMRSRGWRNITVGRLLAYSAAALGLATAVATGGLLGIVAAAFGVGAAVYGNARGGRRDDILGDNYAAYAVLAQEALG